VAQQIPVNPEARADREAEAPGHVHEVAPDLGYKRLTFVNVVFYGKPGAGDRAWVLVDAGITGSAGFIAQAADKRFGRGARPAAIVMTHGHFDHTGALQELAERWQAPVYAHELEMPFLDGSAAYPPPDPSVGGGLMSAVSTLFPRGPIDVRPWLKALPEDGSIPDMPGWRYLHTPGHSPGHISLWREADAALIAGDAFITTKQESAYAALTQPGELHGPPMYYTPDWREARMSVERLTSLDPELAVTGHGAALRGKDMREALHLLARDFDYVAVPQNGRYAA